MSSLLRDVLLSFCPAGWRRIYPPESPPRTLRAATWGGLAEFFLAALALVLGFKKYFVMRAQQMAPQMTGTTEVFQSGIAVIVFFEYLLHPLSLLLLYLAIEGLVRSFGSFTTGEPLPNLGMFLAFKLARRKAREKERRQNAALPADLLETLPDGRIRIVSARPRNNWNSSITLGLNGQWFEVERAEQGAPPRSFVYLLRPAPPGKILRGYEEYDTASALTSGPEEKRTRPRKNE
jgi:hypothetical protein